MSRRRAMQQQDLFGGPAMAAAVAAAAPPSAPPPKLSVGPEIVCALPPRKKKPKKPKRPPTVAPHAAVILAIDPGAKAGAAIFVRDRLVAHFAVFGAEGRRDAVEQAQLSAANLQLPLAVVAERWATGGPFTNPRTMAALGAAWGAWREALELAGVNVKKVVRVYPQTWHAVTVGGRMTRDKTRLVEWVRQRYGVEPASEDAAAAIGIGCWATHAAKVGDVLPKRRAKAP